MYCVKCGAQLPPDSQFCTSCGAKLDNGQVPAQPNVGPIAPPAMDQPFAYGQPPKKKNRALLFTLIGVGVALVAAAILIFVVFAPGSFGPFSGNTTQTRFANDVVGVFTNAASGFEANNDMKKIMDQPFEITVDNTIDTSGVKLSSNIAYAYDQSALGVSVTSATDYSQSELADYFGEDATMESAIKLLLQGDTLYIDQDGSVTGVKFDTDSDLSKPMPLKDRIAALFENNKLSQLDYLKLTELFLNSIDESCFDKSADATKLTLNGKALSETLKTFADKLKNDKELSDALSDMFEELSGYPVDVSSAISLAAPMLEDADFVMTMNISYAQGRPAGLIIAFEESGSSVFELTFNSENEKDGKSITLDVSTAGNSVLTLVMNITKTSSGVDFDGTISVPGSDDVTFNGSAKIDGNHTVMNVELSMADQKVSMNADETVKIGMPSKAVEDDSRFSIDTGSANIVDLKDIFSGGLGGNLAVPSLTE